MFSNISYWLDLFAIYGTLASACWPVLSDWCKPHFVLPCRPPTVIFLVIIFKFRIQHQIYISLYQPNRICSLAGTSMSNQKHVVEASYSAVIWLIAPKITWRHMSTMRERWDDELKDLIILVFNRFIWSKIQSVRSHTGRRNFWVSLALGFCVLAGGFRCKNTYNVMSMRNIDIFKLVFWCFVEL